MLITIATNAITWQLNSILVGDEVETLKNNNIGYNQNYMLHSDDDTNSHDMICIAQDYNNKML